MKYFTIDELCRSEKARALGIANVPGLNELKNMECLVSNVLDPLREAWGKPIKVNSGFRCPKLNKAVGGSASSHHMSGQAADITVGSRSDNKKLYDLVKSLGLKFTQLIDEHNYSWVHVSYVPGNLKMQELKQ